jgi:hypothetical protein
MKQLFFLILLIGFSSCYLIPPKWIRTETGGRQAVAKAYQLSTKNFTFSDLIDTTAVYINEQDYVISDARGKLVENKATYYTFIRFSPNGICFRHSYMLNKPSDLDFNILEGGQFCFYSVKKNIVTIEEYNFDHNMFEYNYGRVQENGDILFFRKKGRPFGTYTGALNEMYRKTPAHLNTKIVFPSKE